MRRHLRPTRWECPNSPAPERRSRTAPQRVARRAHPVGSCATSASTGTMPLAGPARRPTPKEGGPMAEEFRVFVGIDWATDAHQVCVLDPSGSVLSERSVAHEALALQSLADWLIALAGDDAAAVAVGIEVPHGAVVETLLERGLVVFALNPKQLDRFRDRFTV